jgi:integrase/recombinase XerD
MGRPFWSVVVWVNTQPNFSDAFRLYRSGQFSLPQLAYEMHHRGLRNRFGTPVTINGLVTMLKNPFYIGLIRIRKTGQMFDGNHETLVNADMFETVQALIAYIEAQELSAPSVKQHLAALRGLFNWLVVKQVVAENPALFVKGPRFSRQIGITPILESGQMRMLLDSIPVTREVKIPKKHGRGVRGVADVKGLRDRAVIAIMAYTFARVSAVAGLKRGDYRLEGKRARLRMVEKGGKEKLVWLHHEAEEFLDAYLAVARIEGPDEALFPTLDKTHRMSGDPLTRRDMLRIVKERCRMAGLAETFCNHTFRGTGITVFLQNGGTLEAAQDMANHSDPRTTKLYDRRKDLATLSEIERRIAFE